MVLPESVGYLLMFRKTAIQDVGSVICPRCLIIEEETRNVSAEFNHRNSSLFDIYKKAKKN